MSQFFRKHRVLAFIVGFALAAAAGAFAAFVIFSGLKGSAGGSIGNTESNLDALVVAADSSQPISALSAGDSGTLWVTVTNADSSGGHQLNANATASVDASPAMCASYITVGDLTPLRDTNGTTVFATGSSYNPSETKTVGVPISFGGDMPASCENGSYSVNFVGTTS